MDERLAKAIEDRADELAALAADLIRFPTINPPGDAYGQDRTITAGEAAPRALGGGYLQGRRPPVKARPA